MAFTPLVIRDGSNNAQNIQAFQDASGNMSLAQSLDSNSVTYRASANFTPQVTGAVTMITITGSATKTVRIKRIGLTGISTGGGTFAAALQRTSALGAGGTIQTPTIAKLDTNAVAATAVVNHWITSLKAAGTPVGGQLSQGSIVTIIPVATYAPAPAQMLFPEFVASSQQSIVLRGATDFLEVQNIQPTNLVAGTVLGYVIEWTEDAS